MYTQSVRRCGHCGGFENGVLDHVQLVEILLEEHLSD